VALVVAGVALLAVPGEPEPLGVIAMVLLGAGGILAISLAFFAVGRAEDRDRAAEEAARAGRFTTSPPPPRRSPSGRRRDHG
jgi:hypothetical protein